VLAEESGLCSVAFKEWAGVCDALAHGRQSIILRKGGIREEPGPGAFVPEYNEFWLYPTAVHQAQQGLRDAGAGHAPAYAPTGSTVPIGLLARVELIGRVRDEAMLPALEEFHVLTPETVRGRFHYRTPGLWVLVTRIRRREPPFEVAATPEHAGCKTWVMLDDPLPTSDLTAALDDAEWSTRLARLRAILDDGGPRKSPA
jgi:hypothetical protein